MPNITMGAPILEHVKKNVPEIFMDCHMMVSNPEQVGVIVCLMFGGTCAHGARRSSPGVASGEPEGGAGVGRLRQLGAERWARECR